ncbi:hypothetical protein C8R44DRAFT_751183 [Mycena epipterygia]|nr:hypothetical protein C8R44DRAFT_751183 [Mycena epipterygia]
MHRTINNNTQIPSSEEEIKRPTSTEEESGTTLKQDLRLRKATYGNANAVTVVQRGRGRGCGSRSLPYRSQTPHRARCGVGCGVEGCGVGGVGVGVEVGWTRARECIDIGETRARTLRTQEAPHVVVKRVSLKRYIMPSRGRELRIGTGHVELFRGHAKWEVVRERRTLRHLLTGANPNAVCERGLRCGDDDGGGKGGAANRASKSVSSHKVGDGSVVGGGHDGVGRSGERGGQGDGAGGEGDSAASHGERKADLDDVRADGLDGVRCRTPVPPHRPSPSLLRPPLVDIHVATYAHIVV